MIVLEKYLNEKEMQFWDGCTYRRSHDFVKVTVGEMRGLLVQLAIARRARLARRAFTPEKAPPGRVLENVRR